MQRSAFPNAYAKWEGLASRVVAAITGTDATTSCAEGDAGPQASPDGTWPPEAMGPDGLTPRTRRAMHEVMHAFGVTDIGGYCPGGCRTGHIEGSDHYTGHAIDIMLLPMNEANRDLGNRIATWLVANADRLAVKYVIWNDHIWSASAAEGWRHYRHPGGLHSSTGRHFDHLHVSVA